MTARKSKVQRRASEIAAFETGGRNLARGAGFDDTIRFEWSMKCEAVADLSKEGLGAMVDDLDCKIKIQPDGSLEMIDSRDGEELARVPGALSSSRGGGDRQDCKRDSFCGTSGSVSSGHSGESGLGSAS